jgi:hypothetical protein
MLEYQKSLGRRAALGPDAPVFLRHDEDEQPTPARRLASKDGRASELRTLTNSCNGPIAAAPKGT